jgi:hypothetical protein
MSAPADWRRLEFEDVAATKLSEEAQARRHEAEKQTERDLAKPVQQLICDVHEGAIDPDNPPVGRMLYMMPRMVAMMGRVALEQDKLSRRLYRWTVVLAVLTVLIAAMTAMLIVLELRH